MKISRRQSLQGLLGVAVASSLALGTAGTASAQSRAETLRHVMGGVVNSLDPTALGGNRENFSMSVNIYDRLCSFTRKPVSGGFVFDMTNIRGELAEKIDRSPDGLTFVFHVRQGATWHDGTPVTATDVKWSLDRAVTAKTLAASILAGGSLTKAEQFTIIGDRQIEVKLDKPDRLSLASLCTPFAPIFNSSLARKHATPEDPWSISWLKENTAAGGAYIVETYKAGQQLVLKRNENWKNGEGGALPFFHSVIAQTVPEATTRANLLERGDADLAVDIAASDIPGIEERNRVKVFSTPQFNGFQAIAFGTHVAPFDNATVRRAVAAALPYEDMFQAAQFGRGSRLFGADWKEPSDASFPQPMPLKTNIALAKQLLTEAGYPNGFETTFSFSTSLAAVAEPMAALIKESLAQIGIKVDVQKMPDSQLAELQSERKLPFFTDIGVAWLPTQDYFMRVFYSGAARWNFSGWENSEVTEIANKSRFEIDQEKYDAMSRRMIKIVAEEVPMPMVWQAAHDAVMAKNIDGYTYWFHRQADYRDLVRR